jgi:uncharacterized protein YjiS (DUF1127 family)
MFRNIYRAVVLSRTKSAAIQTANMLTQRDLNDIGVSRYELVNSAVELVRKEFDQADLQRAQEARFKVATSNVFADFIANSFLRPLGSTRSHD